MSTETYVKKLDVRNNIFKKKRIPDMIFWIIYNLVQISFFGRLLKGVLASVFLKFFLIGQLWWPTFLLSLSPPPPLLLPTTTTIKELPTALNYLNYNVIFCYHYYENLTDFVLIKNFLSLSEGLKIVFLHWIT